jgi:hypothetical protein
MSCPAGLDAMTVARAVAAATKQAQEGGHPVAVCIVTLSIPEGTHKWQDAKAGVCAVLAPCIGDRATGVIKRAARAWKLWVKEQARAPQKTMDA